MENCVFCKIVKGEIPCSKIWEDEEFLAFLSIDPVCDGHTIVIPKKHYENVFVCEDEILGKLNIVCKKIGLILRERLGCEGVNILNNSGEAAGQEIFHIHFHVFPRFEGDGHKLWFFDKSDNLKNLNEIANKINKEA